MKFFLLDGKMATYMNKAVCHSGDDEKISNTRNILWPIYISIQARIGSR